MSLSAYDQAVESFQTELTQWQTAFWTWLKTHDERHQHLLLRELPPPALPAPINHLNWIIHSSDWKLAPHPLFFKCYRKILGIDLDPLVLFGREIIELASKIEIGLISISTHYNLHNKIRYQLERLPELSNNRIHPVDVVDENTVVICTQSIPSTVAQVLVDYYVHCLWNFEDNWPVYEPIFVFRGCYPENHTFNEQERIKRESKRKIVLKTKSTPFPYIEI